MDDRRQTKAQLIAELTSLRQQVTALQVSASEHQQAAAALRESEERYRTLIEHTHDFVIEASIEGRFLSVSSDYTEILGYEPEELIGKDVFAFMHPDDVPVALAAFVRGVETFTSDQAVFRYRHKNGEWRWFEGTGRPLRTASGEIRVIVASRDITERKRAEDALQEEARVSAALARAGEEMISTLDLPVFLNHLCQLTAKELQCECSYTFLRRPDKNTFTPVAGWGITAEQWEMLRVVDIPSRMIASLLTRLDSASVVEVGPAAGDEWPGPFLEQFAIPVSIHVALRRGGELVGIQSTGYRSDYAPFTTQQRRIAQGIAHLASMALENARLFEQAETANRLKSDFLAIMSHELRTPLHVMMGYNDLLREEEFGALTEDQADILGRMDRSARQLLDMINTTLSVSRLESGRHTLDLQTVYLADLLREIVTDTLELREKAAVQFSWQVNPEFLSLQTDPAKLKIVLKNLLGNALKFTEAGHVIVQGQFGNGGVEISVADTGIGIESEAVSTIFEPFRQLEDVMTRRYGGIGLGLYVVQRLLALLNGTITVESQVGRGSTFRVWLPLTIAAELPATPVH
jgi:PAS domain S-box-containing protein